MSVGVHSLDDEHKSMITEISNLYAFRKSHSRKELQDYISLMVRHAIEHFSNEELYMNNIGFSELPEHIETHGAFLEKIKIIENNMKEDDLYQISDNELNSLARWLFNHILTEDKDYAIFGTHRDLNITVECV